MSTYIYEMQDGNRLTIEEHPNGNLVFSGAGCLPPFEAGDRLALDKLNRRLRKGPPVPENGDWEEYYVTNLDLRLPGVDWICKAVPVNARSAADVSGWIKEWLKGLKKTARP
jgi:hypothetical protein